MCDDDGWEEEPEPLLEPLAMTEVQVIVTDNPVVATLLGPDGAVLAQRRARPRFGFA